MISPGIFFIFSKFLFPRFKEWNGKIWLKSSKKFCRASCLRNYRTPMRKYEITLYWNHTLAWVFSCKFAAYFQNTFPKNTCGGLVWDLLVCNYNSHKALIKDNLECISKEIDSLSTRYILILRDVNSEPTEKQWKLSLKYIT